MITIGLLYLKPSVMYLLEHFTVAVIFISVKNSSDECIYTSVSTVRFTQENCLLTSRNCVTSPTDGCRTDLELVHKIVHSDIWKCKY